MTLHNIKLVIKLKIELVKRKIFFFLTHCDFVTAEYKNDVCESELDVLLKFVTGIISPASLSLFQ